MVLSEEQVFFSKKQTLTQEDRFTSKQVTVAEPLVVSAHQNSSGLRKAKEEFFLRVNTHTMKISLPFSQ